MKTKGGYFYEEGNKKIGSSGSNSSSVVVPVSLKAATCPPHYYVVQPEIIDQYIGGVGKDSHTYFYGYVEDLNGNVTEDYRTCRVDVMVCLHEKICSKCQDVEYYIKQKDYHNSCGLGLVD